jgi:hypothetical protein
VNDEGKKIRADNPEDAADGRANQTPQTHAVQTPFKKNNGSTQCSADDSVVRGANSEGTNSVAGNGYKKYKEKPYENHIHSNTSGKATYVEPFLPAIMKTLAC